MKRKCSIRPRFEVLEDRTVPATLGVAWQDPRHLTMSFAPDGAKIAGHSNSLSATLNRSMTPFVWRRAIARAAQTWASVANLDIGIVNDQGQGIGISGRTQNDSRFGDIRIVAQKMSREVTSISVPYDPFFSGTLAGDVFLNANSSYSADVLQAVALHEIGHTLGLDHDPSPTSVMNSHFNRRLTLSASDISRIRALYGNRSPDVWEEVDGNETLDTATRIQYSSEFTGKTPLAIWGDITTISDVDTYWVKPISGFTGSMTVRMQSRGLSLLAPKLTVTDATGQILGSHQSFHPEGDYLAVTLANVDPAQTYYVRAEGASVGAAGVGRYGVAVSFNGRNSVPVTTISKVLASSADRVRRQDLPAVFLNQAKPLFNPETRLDDSFGTAVELKSTDGRTEGPRYETVGSVTSATDVDIYRIKSPRNGETVLTVDGLADSRNGVVPKITVFDRDNLSVPVRILANGNGRFTVQATNIRAGKNYYVKVQPSKPSAFGNYQLHASFGKVAAKVTAFSSGIVTARESQDILKLYVAQNQLFTLLLSGQSTNGTRVQMDIFNPSKALIYTLIASPGSPASGSSLLLAPGAYTVRFRRLGAGPVSYRLEGASLSKPIGPVIDDPTLAMLYYYQNNPGMFQFPTGTITPNPFIWVPHPNSAPSGLLAHASRMNSTMVALTGSFTDPDFLDTHTVQISWGDASASTVSLLSGVTLFGSSHSYASLATPPTVLGFPIQITVTDNSGGSTSTVTYV